MRFYPWRNVIFSNINELEQFHATQTDRDPL